MSVGATNGQGKVTSTITRSNEDGGVSLEGQATTHRWQHLAQAFSLEPGASYRLRFQARATEVLRQGNQFANCFVGVALKNAAGQRIALDAMTVTWASWDRGSVVISPGPEAQSGEVWIFLSQTGRLEVSNVELETVSASDSADILIEQMDRRYAHFGVRDVDWPGLVASHRHALLASDSADAFATEAADMLRKLGDLHIWLTTPAGRKIPTVTTSPAANYDFQAVARSLASVRQIGRVGLVGRTREGFGYLAVGSLTGDQTIFDEIEQALEDLLDTPGLLLDLRGNVGGDERRAQRLASRLTDQRLVYARHQVRAGSAHDSFTSPVDRIITPHTGKRFNGPVVGLTGPRCVSSGEGFAAMVAALPKATLVGKPTRGASGNPAPLRLPNGVTVWFSRWLSLLPDGTPLERHGVIPDVSVEHQGEGDPTFEAAITELQRRISD